MIKIKKQKITWIIEEQRVIAFDKLQATSYSLINGNSKKDLVNFRQSVIDSDRGNTWAEVVSLASENRLRGNAIRKDRSWLDEFDGLL